MKSRWFFLLPIVMCLCSCSSSLKVTSEDCSGKLYLAKLENSKLTRPNRVSNIEEKNLTSFSFIGNADTIYLGEFLRKKKVGCNNKKALTLTLKNTWSDVLLSLVPFITRTTIKVSIGPIKMMRKN